MYYGLVAGIVVFSVGHVMTYFSPKYRPHQPWTVGKELICINIMLLVATLANTALGTQIEFCPNINVYSVWDMMVDDFIHTYTIGILASVILTAVMYSIFLNRNLAKVNAHNRALDARKNQPSIQPFDQNATVTILSSNSNSSFTFKLHDLLFIMADGNYVEFHLESDNAVKREIQRNTLSHIESQLAEYNFLFRSHRAYLVNLKKVVHSSGNAQGYELKLTKTDHVVPVSRKNLGRFDDLLNS